MRWVEHLVVYKLGRRAALEQQPARTPSLPALAIQTGSPPPPPADAGD